MGYRVALAVTLREYAVKLATFLREEEPEWEVCVYTNFSALRTGLERKPDLFIGTRELVIGFREAGGVAANTIVLTEERDVIEEETAARGETTALYQPLHSLLSAIRSMRSSKPLLSSGKGTQVVTVFSASGGVGKTTVALNIVRHVGELGARVLYLNLEPLNATSLLFGRGEPDSFSRLIYALQSDSQSWVEEFRRLKRHQPQLRADYLDAPEHPGERLALHVETMESLINGLRQSGLYDAIVIDPDSGAGEWHRDLLRASDLAIWLVVDDAHALLKTDKLYRHWQDAGDSGPCAFVLNKAIGTVAGSGMQNRWSMPFGLSEVMLPYIPHWKAVDQPARVLADATFAGAIGRMCECFGIGGLTDKDLFEKARRGAVHGSVQRTRARGTG
ncbi:AAA family ATPase [Cohnella soli]|uniref:AAA family ATPase n=1 Tax=Cohnella soli TaxID=425005 RepID=A0ABW0HN49_9BACL